MAQKAFSRLTSTLGLNMASPRRHCSPENEMEGQEWTGAWVGGKPALFTALDQVARISLPLPPIHIPSDLAITFHPTVLDVAYFLIVHFVSDAFVGLASKMGDLAMFSRNSFGVWNVSEKSLPRILQNFAV